MQLQLTLQRHNNLNLNIEKQTFFRERMEMTLSAVKDTLDM